MEKNSVIALNVKGLIVSIKMDFIFCTARGLRPRQINRRRTKQEKKNLECGTMKWSRESKHMFDVETKPRIQKWKKRNWWKMKKKNRKWGLQCNAMHVRDVGSTKRNGFFSHLIFNTRCTGTHFYCVLLLPLLMCRLVHIVIVRTPTAGHEWCGENARVRRTHSDRWIAANKCAEMHCSCSTYCALCTLNVLTATIIIVYRLPYSVYW